MSALLGLQCHVCKTMFPAEALYVCDRCLGPLEPVYDYASIRLTREQIEERPKNLWRYRELLFFLAWRDVKIRYKQTVLGLGWSVLQPALLMVAFVGFLSRYANLSSGATPYPLE